MLRIQLSAPALPTHSYFTLFITLFISHYLFINLYLLYVHMFLTMPHEPLKHAGPHHHTLLNPVYGLHISSGSADTLCVVTQWHQEDKAQVRFDLCHHYCHRVISAIHALWPLSSVSEINQKSWWWWLKTRGTGGDVCETCEGDVRSVLGTSVRNKLEAWAF